MADYTVDVLVDVDGSQLDAAERKIKSLGGKVPVTLDVTGDMPKDKRATVRADIKTDKDSMNALKNRRVTLKADIKTDRDSMNALKNRRVTLKVDIRTDKDSMNALKNRRVNLKADIKLDNDSMAVFKGKRITLKADIETDRSSLNSLKNQRVTVEVDVDKDKLSKSVTSATKEAGKKASVGSSKGINRDLDILNNGTAKQRSILTDLDNAYNKITKSGTGFASKTFKEQKKLLSQLGEIKKEVEDTFGDAGRSHMDKTYKNKDRMIGEMARKAARAELDRMISDEDNSDKAFLDKKGHKENLTRKYAPIMGKGIQTRDNGYWSGTHVKEELDNAYNEYIKINKRYKSEMSRLANSDSVGIDDIDNLRKLENERMASLGRLDTTLKGVSVRAQDAMDIYNKQSNNAIAKEAAFNKQIEKTSARFTRRNAEANSFLSQYASKLSQIQKMTPDQRAVLSNGLESLRAAANRDRNFLISKKGKAWFDENHGTDYVKTISAIEKAEARVNDAVGNYINKTEDSMHGLTKKANKVRRDTDNFFKDNKDIMDGAFITDSGTAWDGKKAKDAVKSAKKEVERRRKELNQLVDSFEFTGDMEKDAAKAHEIHRSKERLKNAITDYNTVLDTHKAVSKEALDEVNSLKKTFDKNKKEQDRLTKELSKNRIDPNANKNNIKDLESNLAKAQKQEAEIARNLTRRIGRTGFEDFASDFNERSARELASSSAKFNDDINRLLDNTNNKFLNMQQKKLGSFRKQIDDFRRTYSSLLDDPDARFTMHDGTVLTGGQVRDNINSLEREVYSSVSQMESAESAARFDPIAANINSFKDSVEQTGKVMNANLSTFSELSSAVRDTDYANKELARTYKSQQQLEKQRKKILGDTEKWQNNNTKSIRKFGNELQGIQDGIKKASSVNELDEISNKFDKFKKNVEAAGQSGMSFKDEFGRYFGRAAMFGLAFEGLMGGVYVLADMARNVKEVDSAMTELYRVTDLSSKQYDNLYSGMVQSANDYGSTLSDIISSTAAWARLGFDPGVSREMAEVSAMYQHIADLSYDEAVENLITGYKGFEKELLSKEKFDGDEAAAMEYVSDIYNEIGNNFAISSGQVGDSLTRAASALQVGGNTFEESAAMVTAVSEVTQDPEKAGNAMKILSLRLRGMKGELEEVETGASEGVESISKMQTQVLNMTKGKVNIFDENGDFKSTYDIMKGIAEVWDELGSVEQAELLETIAGKHRANDVAALIDNWDTAEAVIRQTEEAMGSSEREHAKYLDSIEGRIAQLTGSWQVFSATAMNTDFVKGTVSGLNEILLVVTSLVDTLGTFPVLAGLAGTALSGFGNIGFFKTRYDDKSGKTRMYSPTGQVFAGAFEEKMQQSRVFGSLGTSLSGSKHSNYNRSNFKKDSKHLAQDLARIDKLSEKYQSLEGTFDVNRLIDPTEGKGDSKDLRRWVEDNKGLLEKGYTDAQLKALYTQQSFGPDRIAKAASPSNFNYAANMNAILEEFNSCLYTATGRSQKFGMTQREISDAVRTSNASAGVYLDNLSAQNEEYIKNKDVVRDTSKDMSMQERAVKDAGDAVDKQKNSVKEAAEALDDFGESGKKAGATQATMGGIAKSGISGKLAGFGAKALTSIASGGMAMIGALAFDAAITGIVKLINYQKDLAKEVDEVTSTYKNNRRELLNVADSYEQYADRYMQLKNGVSSITGANKSLTSGEYEEYQQIANSIAEITPSLVKGFDAQGNAILKNVSSVDELNNAYDELIIDENNKLLNGDGEDYKGISEISKDLNLAYAGMKKSYGDGISLDSKKALEEVLKLEDITAENVSKISMANKGNLAKSLESALELSGKEVDIDLNKGMNNNYDEYIAEVCKTHPEVAREISRDFSSAFDAEVEPMRTAMQAHLENAFLSKNYENIDEETQSLASQLVKNMDSEFIAELNKNGGEDAVKGYLNGMLNTVNDFDSTEMEMFKSGFDLTDKFTSGEISYGEYTDKLKEFTTFLDESGLDEEVVSQIKITLNTEEVQEQYDSLKKRLTKEGLAEDAAKEFIDGLSSSELTAAINLIEEGSVDFSKIDLTEFREMVEHEAKLIEAMSFSLNIDVETEGLEKFNTAIAESNSAIGLSSSSIESIKARYSDLEGYDPSAIFEKTTTGVRLNTEALKALENQYVESNKATAEQQLDVLTLEYERLTKAMREAEAAGDKDLLKSLEVDRTDIADSIEQAQLAIAAYEGLTSAYNEWLQAQQGGQEGDIYDSILSGRENAVTLAEEGKWGNTELQGFVKMFSTEGSLDNATPQQFAEAWGSALEKSNRYFQEGTAGLDNFFSDVNAVNSDLVKMSEDGSWVIEPGVEIEDLAEASEMSNSAVEAILGQANEYGADFEIGVESPEELVAKSQEATEALKASMGEDFEISIDTEISSAEEATSEIDRLKGLRDEISDSSADVEVKQDGIDAVNDAIEYTLDKKIELEQPAYMELETSEVKSSMQDALTSLQDYQTAANEVTRLEGLQSAGIEIDVGQLDSAKAKVDEAAQAIAQLDGDVKVAIGLEATDGVEEIKQKIESGQVTLTVDTDIDESGLDLSSTSTTVSVTPEPTTTNLGNDFTGTGTVTMKADNKNLGGGFTGTGTATLTAANKNLGGGFTGTGTATMEPDKTDFGSIFTGSGTVTMTPSSYDLGSGFSGTGTVTVTVNEVQGTKVSSGNGPAAGTAHSVGSTSSGSGRAFVRGDWGIKGSGVALGGELGQEIVVRDGRFFTIGDNGAEFFNYRSGDIVFNAAQTESLFKYGGIKGAKPRGTMLATGTAFASGNAFVEGRAFANVTGGWKPGGYGGASSSSSSSSSSSGSSSNSGSNSNSISNAASDTKEAAEEFEEAIDWIEKAIDRLERAIDELDTKLGSTYRSWSERNKSITENIGNITDMIDLQKKAYDRYIEEANSVGLSDDYAEKVRNGTIDIETITDEDLNEKIGEYTEWYEKALDCKDALVELQEAQSELYETAFEHVATEYEGYLAAIEHEKTMLEEYINQSEERGWIVSAEYYDALIKNQKETTKELEKERAKLIDKMHEATDSGAIAIGSEAWYEMIQEIDDITASIEEGSTALIEYANNIRDIEWEVFDFLQNQISEITTEAEFLIDLMSNKKLYEDNGQLTDEGMATMGVHGVNYNIHMYQADMYGEEVKNLDKLLEDDPYDQEIIDRRQEILKLQQESIMAAEEEKNAIRDMVEEGIELELESLEELIDKYLEALDAEKDLYDYQRKVKKQAEEIASLEKQVSAFEGDDSEEAKQKIQELKVSLEEAEADLEETEYEKYISDQEQLLDELYTEYETILNERLDNIDALVADMIEQINANSAQINATIAEQTGNVGYTISTELNKIFNGGKDISGINTLITSYGNDFKNKLSVTNNTLNAMHLNVQKMIGQLNKLAKTNVTAAKTKSQAEAEKKRKEEEAAKAKKEQETKKKATDEVMKGIAASIWVYGDASGWGNDPVRSGRVTEKFDAATAKQVQSIINSQGPSGELYNFWVKNKYNLDKYKYSAFKSGIKDIDETQLAWTQEGKKKEFIVRPSDGAILTPLTKGDSVLNADASRNIWDMANDPSEFIKDNMDITSVSIPSNGSNNNTYVQNLDKVVFSLPNITNYSEFVSALQRDKSFEKLVKSMTIDRLAGGSSLAKTKSIR